MTRRDDARALRDWIRVLLDQSTPMRRQERRALADVLQRTAQRIDAVEDAVSTLLDGHVQHD